MSRQISEPSASTASDRARMRDLGNPGRFSSARSFSPPVGSRVRPGELGGYYIDFTIKTDTPEWPPFWLAPLEKQIHVATAQWGLGCYERFLRGEDERWLAAATAAADHLLAHQEQDGPAVGGWFHRAKMPHTYHLPVPWLSAMAQGEGASLFVRIHHESGDERYAEAALRALRPLERPTAGGGLRAALGDGFFLEEYPTDPASLVLNGGIFALWGFHDVWLALGDERARRSFDEGVETLAANLWRWDAGRWSLYDLFPHPVPNIASSAYHLLHTTQLRAMELVAPRPEFQLTADRFEEYSRSRLRRVEAFTRKVAFRFVVPRNSLMAHRMPFGPRRATS
jgi:heparosan-N-sulfate-glucuronate 5-epimerase